MKIMRNFSAIVLLALLVGLTGCATPQISVDCARTASGDLQFTFHKNSKVNALMDMRVWSKDATNYLWFVSVGGHQTNTLIWGEVPDYKYSGSPQKFPKPPAKPVPPKAGHEFYVGLGFQYDSAWPPSACAADAFFKFGLTSQGEVQNLGVVWHPGLMERFTERINEPAQAWPQQISARYRR